MSTEEIIQRTRLLDSEIKVGRLTPVHVWSPNKTRPADPSLHFYNHNAGGLGPISWNQRKQKRKLN